MPQLPHKSMNGIETRQVAALPYGKISPVDILSILNPQQRQAVTARPRPDPGTGRSWLGQDACADPPHCLPDQQPGRAPLPYSGSHLHQQSRPRDGKPPGEAARTGHQRASGWAPSTPFARAFCAAKQTSCHSTRILSFLMTMTSMTLVKRALKELNLDEKTYRPNSVHAAISTAKNNLIFPQNFDNQNLPRRSDCADL